MGRQTPRQRTLRLSRTLTFSMRRDDRTNSEGCLCPGVAPPDPCTRLLLTCGEGPGGASGDEKLMDGRAGVSCPSLPQSQVYGAASPPAWAARFSRTLTLQVRRCDNYSGWRGHRAGGCPGHAGSVGPERRSSIIPRTHRRMDQSMFVQKHFTPSHCGLSSRIACAASDKGVMATRTQE